MGTWNTIAFEALDTGDQGSVAADQRKILGVATRLRQSAEPVAYQAPDGTNGAWTGDYEAPYVKVINTPDNPVQVTLISGGIPDPLTVDGLGPDAQVGVLGQPTASSQWALSKTYQTAAAATNVVKASPGRIYQCYVFNPSGGVRTFQLFNLAAAPGAGTVPDFTPIELPDDTALFLDFGLYGMYFSTGITMGSSSSVATFTSSAGLHMTMLWL